MATKIGIKIAPLAYVLGVQREFSVLPNSEVNLKWQLEAISCRG